MVKITGTLPRRFLTQPFWIYYDMDDRESSQTYNRSLGFIINAVENYEKY